jgi:hypothetical protein
MLLSQDESELAEFLSHIRAHPSIFLAGVSFERLHGAIVGFMLGRYPDGGNWSLIDKFQDWLRKQTGIGDWASWHRIIRCLSSDDHDAFNLFFRQFTAFIDDLRAES